MLYVVSGAPRSGTSMMMDIMRTALGEDRLIGNDFPKLGGIEYFDKPFPDETQEAFELRKMLTYRKGVTLDKLKKDMTRSANMNPNGFYECQYTMKGLSYSYANRKDIKKLEEEEKHSFCKIISQGLVGTDPRYVKKVIYMLRHPFHVAKSQIDIQRKNIKLGDVEIEQEAYSTEYFIQSSYYASLWLHEYKNDVDVLVVDYNELIDNPNKQLTRVRRFLGEGDFVKARSVVDSKLRRNKTDETPPGIDWKESIYLFEQLKNKKFKNVLAKIDDPFSEYKKSKAKFKCPRVGREVKLGECMACSMFKNVKDNYKKQAEVKGLNWKAEPCLFECSTYAKKIKKSITQSIVGNSWLDGELISLDQLKSDIGNDKRKIFEIEFPNVEFDTPGYIDKMFLHPLFLEKLSIIYGQDVKLKL